MNVTSNSAWMQAKIRIYPKTLYMQIYDEWRRSMACVDLNQRNYAVGLEVNEGISTGSPTRMKNLANDCERCSRYGGIRRSRFI